MRTTTTFLCRLMPTVPKSEAVSIRPIFRCARLQHHFPLLRGFSFSDRISVEIRFLASLLVLLMLPLASQAVGKSLNDVLIAPDKQGAKITDWGYDIKEPGRDKLLTPALANDIFMSDQLTVLRVAIFGDDPNPAHPRPGVVVESFYADQLSAMANARKARSNVKFYADKKLSGLQTFPNWCKSDGGLLPLPYARMIADYLQFMKNHGYAIDMLGINCEPEANEGVFTAAKHIAVIDELRRLSKTKEFSFVMPPQIVGPNSLNPGFGFHKKGDAHGAQFIKDFDKHGSGNQLNILGTHWQHHSPGRPRENLDDFCHEARSRPTWNTEVHWKDQSGDVIADAENAMDGVFDCVDSGMTGFVWWSYHHEETSLKGSLIHRLTLSTLNSRPIDVDDLDGRTILVDGKLVTRGFRKGQNCTVWVVNNSTAAYSPCKFRLTTQTIAGNVTYTQWTANASVTGSATLADDKDFSIRIPEKTVTQVTFSISGGK